MKILAIETSCDETSVAIAEFSGSKKRPGVRVLSHIVLSQIKLHQEYGGVVPNLARREHEKNLVPILLQATNESGLKIKNKKILNSKRSTIYTILNREPELLKRFEEKILSLPVPDIDAIAVTYGPGLAPALWVGVNFAKALATLWDKPLIPVNHMEGHLFSAFLRQEADHYALAAIRFPVLGLLVSGGHTELILMEKFGKYRLIGETLDDAAGEAFDKAARMLGLGYPGGPALSAEAEKLQTIHYSLQIKLPRPMLNSKDFNFSFSGLKTAVLYLTRDLGKQKTKKLTPVIAKEFQGAVVDVLVVKTVRAAKQYKVKTVAIGGGVSANVELRTSMETMLKKELPGVPLLLPMLSLTGDNALMIALSAYSTGKKKASAKINAEANLSLARPRE